MEAKSKFALHLFVLLKPLTNWMMPTCTGGVIFIQTTNSNADLFQEHPPRHTPEMLAIWTFHSPVKLTHKIIHSTGFLVGLILEYVFPEIFLLFEDCFHLETQHFISSLNQSAFYPSISSPIIAAYSHGKRACFKVTNSCLYIAIIHNYIGIGCMRCFSRVYSLYWK